MPFRKELAMTRSELTTVIINLIQEGAIDDISLTDVEAMSWVRMFYIALRHSEAYIEAMRVDFPALNLTESAFHEQFLRVQFLMDYFHEHPPVAQHIKLVENLTAELRRMKTIDYPSLEAAKDDLDKVLFGYLRDICAHILKVTASNASLSKYLRSVSKFYHDPQDPIHLIEDFDFHEYRMYEEALVKFKQFCISEKVPPSGIGYIFSDDPRAAVSYVNVDEAIPIVSNFLPHSIGIRFRSSNPDFFTMENLKNEELVDVHKKQRSLTGEPENLFSQFTLGGTHSKTPFRGRPAISFLPTGYDDYRFGSLNELATSSGKGKEKEKSPSGNGSPSPQVSPPLIPDDSGYTPNSILAFQMRHFVEHIQKLDPMEMRLDHMTRFARTDEFAQQLTKWEVRFDDARTFERNSRAGKMFVITFTRKGRKPIFNPVN